MEKLDPQLWTLLEQRERAHAQAVTRNERDAVRLADAPIEVHVEFDGESEALRSAGFPLYGLVPGAARGGLSTGSPEAVARLRFPQNVACGFPALRSSAGVSQHCKSLQLRIWEAQLCRCYLFKFRFHGQLIFSLNRRPRLPLNGAHVAQEQFTCR